MQTTTSDPVQEIVEDTRWIKQCPRFEGSLDGKRVGCSCNVCPLDPNRHLRAIVPGDPETTCRASIQVRVEIATKAKAAGVQLDPMNDREQRSDKTVEQLVAAEAIKREQGRLRGVANGEHLKAARQKQADARQAKKDGQVNS